MFDFFTKQSIKKQFLILLFLLITSFITLYLYSFFKIANDYYTNSINELESRIETFQDELLSMNNKISTLISGIAYSPATQKYLKETDHVNRYDNFLELDSVITNLETLLPGIVKIVLIAPNGNNYSYSNEFARQIDEFTLTIPELHNGWYSGIKSVRVNLSYIDIIFVGIPVYNLDKEMFQIETLGKLVLMLNMNDLVQSNKNYDDLFLIGMDSFVIMAPDKKDVGTIMNLKSITLLDADSFSPFNLFSNREKVIYREVKPMRAFIAGTITQKELFSDFLELLKRNSIIFILILIFISILYTAVMSNIIRVHSTILNFIRGIKQEDFQGGKQGVIIRGYSEAEVIGENLNSMVEKIGSLTNGLIDANKELYELELTTKKAEMSYLINQINPHFLYNTLESIKGLASKKGIPEIQEVIQSLGGMFRYSLIKKDNVTLGDEISLIDNYFMIQKLRFQNRFNVFQDIPCIFLDNTIPKMMLQPIVENAIFHGLELKPGGGELRLSARESKEGDLIIRIKDNGLGMDSKKLKIVQERIDSCRDSEDGSIGLSNVNKRLKLTYGAKYGISIDSKKDRGTTVVVKLPLLDDKYV